MSKLRLTPLAKADLDRIWDYTLRQWNEDQAESYMQALDMSMQLVLNNPGLGRPISDVRSGYFKFPASSHFLIFRIKSTHLEIVRILHKTSDIDRHLDEM